MLQTQKDRVIRLAQQFEESTEQDQANQEKVADFATRLRSRQEQSHGRRPSRLTLWSMRMRDDLTVLVVFVMRVMHSFLNAASAFLRLLLSLVMARESGRVVGSAPVRWEVAVARAAAKVIIAILLNAMVISAAVVLPIARLGAALMKSGEQTAESNEKAEVAVEAPSSRASRADAKRSPRSPKSHEV